MGSEEHRTRYERKTSVPSFALFCGSKTRSPWVMTTHEARYGDARFENPTDQMFIIDRN
jgi:hypothetical protein